MRSDDREILRLALPAFAALIAEPLYVLADTAVVGHLGTDELAGLAVASAVLLTGYAIFIFLAYGTTGAVARLIGAGDDRSAAHEAVQGLWLAAIIAVPVAGLTAGFAEPLVRALGAEGAVAANATTYLRISAAGIPALLLTLAGIGYLRGAQDTRTPLAVAAGTNVVNLGVELVLIAGFGYGIGASALATVIAQWLGTGVYLVRIIGPVRRLGVDVAPDRRSLGRLALSGGALFVRTVALRGALLVATVVATNIGAVEVGAHHVAFELWSFLALGLDAVAIAGQSLVGHALGSADAGRARALAQRMLELGVLAGIAAGAAVLALRHLLPELFSGDEAVVELAAFLLLFVALNQPVNAIVFVLDGVLIGAGDLTYMAWAMSGAALLFVALAGLVAGLGLGIGWLWAAISTLQLARLVTLWLRFRTDHWLRLGATVGQKPVMQ